MKLTHIIAITALLGLGAIWTPVHGAVLELRGAAPGSAWYVIQPYTPWQTWARALVNLQGQTAYDFRRGEIGGGITQETAIPPLLPFLWNQRDWFVVTGGMAAFQTRRVGFVGAKVKIVPLLDKLAPAHPATTAIDNRFIRLDVSAFVGTNFDRIDPAYGLMVDILRKDFLK